MPAFPDPQLSPEDPRALLQEVLQATSDFVGMFDSEGRAHYMNWPLRSFCGYEFDHRIEADEVAWFDHYAPWAAELLREEGIPAALQDGSWIGETALIGWEGTEIPVSELIVVHRDAAGEIHRISSVARDITDQKRNQDTLEGLIDDLADLKLAMEESTIVAVTDAQGNYTEVNRAFCEISGFSTDELLGSTPKVINSGFHPPEFFAGLWSTIQGGNVWRGEIRNRAKDGEIYWVDSVIVPRLGQDGAPRRYLVLGMDVTERKRGEEELRASETRFRTLIEAARSVVVGIRPDGAIIEWNPEAERIFGCRRADALGQPFLARFLPFDERNRLEPLIQRVLEGEYIHDFEMEVPDRQGEPATLLWNLTRILDSEGAPTALIGTAQDITERKAAAERAVYMAHHDNLTKLPNRVLLRERVAFALIGAERHQQRLALLFVDMDRFKSINDTFGHDIGDLLLVEVARRISGCVRKGDTVARLGGDEFVVFLPDIRETRDAALVAEKIIESLGRPFQLGAHQVNSSPSMGIAIYPDHGPDLDTLTKRADEAMYRAKHGGRNRFEFA
jgi:diguanylate cyclase (GGDEF)-like protein/PAS domain S-box-containing protein